jgi:hypothetical protein
MDESQLAELGGYYDDYLYGNRKLASTQQAIVCFKAIAREIHAAAGGENKTKLKLEQYIAVILLPEVLQYLDKRQAKHPVVTPEILKKKE